MKTVLNKKQSKLKQIILTGIPNYDPLRDAGKYYLDIGAAAFAISFFEECLIHVKGKKFAGKPFVLRDWEKAIIGNIFGWKQSNGLRRYREAYIEVPRKNGKSTIVAGLVIFVLFCDNEPGAEIYSAAADRGQASLVFDIAKSMVLAEPELRKRCGIYRHSISIDSMGSCYKPISSDANTKHGFNAHVVIIDELHAQPNRELVDTLITSTAARSQPLIIHITTAGYDRQSICYEKYDYACKVRDGILKDPEFLPVIYETKLEDEWQSEKTWKKANPNYGISLSKSYIKRECQKATEQPTYENTFKRLHLNIWTSSDVRWLPTDRWLACGKEPIIHESLIGRKCYGGLDLASVKDLAAFALIFPGDDGFYDTLGYYFAPQENAEKREKRDKVPYLTWGRQGWLELTPGRTIDYDYIRKKMNDLRKIYQIVDNGFDRWNATQIIKQLSDDGFTMVEFGQGYKDMSPAAKELERLIMAEKIRHGNNPVLNWAASTVAIEIDAAGNIKPSKKKSTERIDPITALVMAVGRAMNAAKKESVYDEHEIKTI